MSRVAVIGSGVSGAFAARMLHARHDVTLFEASPCPGGHARTVDVQLGDQRFPVDTGFMVFNQRTYPHFCRLLDRLGVASRASDMSFSVSCQRTGLEYQGSSPRGLFAQRRNLACPGFWRMLRDIVRFNRRGTQAVADGRLTDGRTVGEFLQEIRVGQRFVSHYLVPMSAAIWSSDPCAILDFPARFMLGFFANHGLMQLTDRPQWRTIIGGSRTYVDALLREPGPAVRLGTPIESVVRTESEVLVKPVDQPAESFEQVVFACHADQALRLLQSPTHEEREVLSAFPYQQNESVLHTDPAALPDRPAAWASWNYRLPAADHQAASVTYDLSRLQGHASPRPILLTLNPCAPIDPSRVIQRHTFEHPAYSRASIRAQRRWHEISGANRTHYCGAYWGYGFHEDGLASGLAVAETFGLGWDTCEAAFTRARSRTDAALR